MRVPVLSLFGVQTTIQRGVESAKERIRLHPVRFTVTALVVLLGLFLRARGFLFDRHGLWVDEATWAIMLMRDPLTTLLIRPIGFMGLSKVLALVFGPTEVVLRSLSWLAGVGVVLLAPALSQRLFRGPLARLLFVAVLALHPAAIDLAKEFKPYSVSLFGHLVVLHLVLRYLDTQRAPHLVMALVAATVAGLFAQDMVMAYPGVFLMLGWDTFRHRRERLPWVMGGALVLLLVLFAQYWFIWRNIEPGEASEYWGHKYNVFHTKSAHESRLGWWFTRYREVAEFPGLRHDYWDATWLSAKELKSLAGVDGWLWQLLHAAGIVALFAFRRFRAATLLLMPFVTITLMNVLGHWPFGMFRTNLFLVGYGAAIAATVFDWPDAPTTRWFVVMPATVLVLLPLVLLDRSWNATKRALAYQTDLPRVLSALVGEEPVPPDGNKTLLVLSRRTCDTYEYYAKVHPKTSRRYGKALEETFDVRCFMQEFESELPALVPPGGHAWLLTDIGRPQLDKLKQRLRRKVSFTRRAYAMPHKLERLTLVQP